MSSLGTSHSVAWKTGYGGNVFICLILPGELKTCSQNAHLRVGDIIPLYAILGSFVTAALRSPVVVPAVAQNKTDGAQVTQQDVSPRRPKRLKQKISSKAVKTLRVSCSLFRTGEIG